MLCRCWSRRSRQSQGANSHGDGSRVLLDLCSHVPVYGQLDRGEGCVEVAHSMSTAQTLTLSLAPLFAVRIANRHCGLWRWHGGYQRICRPSCGADSLRARSRHLSMCVSLCSAVPCAATQLIVTRRPTPGLVAGATLVDERVAQHVRGERMKISITITAPAHVAPVFQRAFKAQNTATLKTLPRSRKTSSRR